MIDLLCVEKNDQFLIILNLQKLDVGTDKRNICFFEDF